MRRIMSGAVACLPLCAAPALAQDDLKAPKDDWTLRFEPYVWFSAPGGKVQLPGAPNSAGRLDMTDLEIDSPRVNPGGTLYLNADHWHFSLGGFRLEEDNQRTSATFAGQLGPVPFSPGDALTSSMTFTSFEAMALRSIELPDSISGVAGKDFAATLDLGFGLRVYDVDFSFAAPSGSTSADRFFVHPLVSAQLTMNLIEHFSIKAAMDMGGFATGGDDVNYGYSITATFGWHPIKTVAVEIGYRDLAYLLRSGSEGNRFECRGAIQGLFAGVELRF